MNIKEMNRKEIALKIASGAIFIASTTAGVSNFIQVGNLEAEMEKNPAYSYSLVLDEASRYLSGAKSNLTYSTGSIKVGDVSVPYTNYPDGHLAWENIRNATSDLSKEPKIINEILGAVDSIPDKDDIKTFRDEDVDNSTFAETRDKIEEIRGEIASVSAINKSDVRLSLDEQNAAQLRAILFIMLGTLFSAGLFAESLNVEDRF